MILGIETSTTHASLAVFDPGSGAIAWQKEFVSERAHNAVIFDPVEELLEGFREELSGIVVGLGPGSYGGVRVGISVANGISIVLGVPVLGLSSLGAWGLEVDSWYVLGDARRKSIFVARIDHGQLQGEPELLPEDSIQEKVKELSEQGATLVTPDSSVADRWPGVELSYPHAIGLLRNPVVAAPESWPVGKALEPHYLRAPYITTPKKKPGT